ncbi:MULTISPECIES: NAD(P)H-quinone dehydrogenase [unclassified Pseudactinotalea]|uniref:NAD(P)H-quinone dehydrogenase n=1 Tax=Micrococcales TaxID=85006 RepID=UPI003C7B72F0
MARVTSEIPPPAEPPSGVRRSTTREGSRVVIIGGGPGGYEAALVAAQLGAGVTLIERQGLGGSAVLTDVVPSKTLIATAEWMTLTESSRELGIKPTGGHDGSLEVDLNRVNQRVLRLAGAQSRDIRARLQREGITLVDGTGRLDGPGAVIAETDQGRRRFAADVILLATGARPRVLPTAEPDGERILTWTQMYEAADDLEKLIVVGSGVTGAEFAGAYNALGVPVVLVSSRDRVLPGEDADAAELIETVFRRRGMDVMSRSRAAAVHRTGDGVDVELTDGQVVTGSHCLLAVGGVPNSEDLGLAQAGVATTESGHIEVDRVSRTTVRGVYAAGDVTGVLPLASVAAMQGRIAMWHSLGDAVSPLDLQMVSANIFTAPEIATVGIPERAITEREVNGKITMLPLAGNPRAKMLGITEGFIKVFSHRSSGLVLGGVVVAPRASELIFPLTLAISNRLTVDEVSAAFTVYPSLSGSIAEAARLLHATET